jgi:hypothetical protein
MTRHDIGTVTSFAPEVPIDEDCDQSTEVFAFGYAIFELLTGIMLSIPDRLASGGFGLPLDKK